MSELISGKEAICKAIDGEDVLFKCKSQDKWHSFIGETWEVSDLVGDFYEFRLKPRTVNLNGVEIPACGTDYKPHTFMFVLNSIEPCEYSKIILDESDEIPLYWWKSEEEIKQVVSALRSVFETTP